MALKIVWTLIASKNLTNVIRYLDENWTIKEILNLELKLNKLLSRISKHPSLYPVSSVKNEIRKALVDKNNYIIYRIDFANEKIEILNFRGTKQKPV